MEEESYCVCLYLVGPPEDELRLRLRLLLGPWPDSSTWRREASTLSARLSGGACGWATECSSHRPQHQEWGSFSASVSLGCSRIAHTYIHTIGMPLPLQESWSRTRHLSNLCDWNWRPQLQTSATPQGRYVRPSGAVMRTTRDRWERSDDDGACPLAADLACGGEFVAATVFVADGLKYLYVLCIRPSSIGS